MLPQRLFPKFYIKYRVTCAVVLYLKKNFWNTNIKYCMTCAVMWVSKIIRKYDTSKDYFQSLILNIVWCVRPFDI